MEPHRPAASTRRIPGIVLHARKTIEAMLTEHGIEATVEDTRRIAGRICGFGRKWDKIPYLAANGGRTVRPGHAGVMRSLHDELGIPRRRAKELAFEFMTDFDWRMTTMEEVDNLLLDRPEAGATPVDRLGLGERSVRILRRMDIGDLEGLAQRSDEIDATTLSVILRDIVVGKETRGPA